MSKGIKMPTKKRKYQISRKKEKKKEARKPTGKRKWRISRRDEKS